MYICTYIQYAYIYIHTQRQEPRVICTCILRYIQRRYIRYIHKKICTETMAATYSVCMYVNIYENRPTKYT